MPAESVHLDQAGHNGDVLAFLATRPELNSDWMTTVAFYKALHLVEAVLASRFGVHSPSHDSRRQLLKSERSLVHIYHHYRVLDRASQIARYLTDPATGMDVPRFADFLPPAKVVGDVVGHWLREVEKSVGKLLPGKWPRLKPATPPAGPAVPPSPPAA